MSARKRKKRKKGTQEGRMTKERHGKGEKNRKGKG